MKKWWLKAIVQKIISYLPYSTSINAFFQANITKQIFLSDYYFFDRVEHARDHLNYYKQFSNNEFPNICLELGTGWYPTIPISFFLVGSQTIYSVDISFLTSKEKVISTIKKYLDSNENGTLANYINIKPDRLLILQNIYSNAENLYLDEVLKKLHIVYLIEDARNISLANNSIDLITSNNTFEHIYPSILSAILQEMKRIVKKDVGIMSHIIDMSDHFAHFDTSINIYNFLSFSNIQWKLIDNNLAPQSRLRYYEYKDLYKLLDISVDFETMVEGNLYELEKIQLHARFKNKPAIQTAYSSCHFISIC